MNDELKLETRNPKLETLLNELRTVLERQGISPRRALRAAATALRSLALSNRPPTVNRIETLLEMREGICDLLQERGLDDQSAELVSWQTIHWLRRNWGGRTLFLNWWGFFGSRNNQAPAAAAGDLFPVSADLVRSLRGRELRAVVFSTLSELTLSKMTVPGICHHATAVAALVETEWAGVYLPKGDELDRLERDRQLYGIFSGMESMDRIRATLGLSQSRAYELHKRIQAERGNREQPEFKF